MSLRDDLLQMGTRARGASRALARLSSQAKDDALEAMAAGLEDARAELQEVNRRDLDAAHEAGLSSAMIDRLTLSDEVIAGMAQGLREVAALPDPVGEVTGMWKRPNGLVVGKKRVPLGVIAMIYESRPNVTADAGGLCLKSGNAVILRGGHEALHSSLAIAGVLGRAGTVAGIPEGAIQVVATTDRAAVGELLQLDRHIDLVIPRGGEGLIRYVTENSRIPVIQHFKGVCHAFVDASADLDAAEAIVMNGKVQRPGVCNALETLLVHRDAADAFLPRVGRALAGAGVQIRGCSETVKRIEGAVTATGEDWDAEYLDLVLAVRVVDSLDGAMDHIAAHGSLHTEVIVTRDYESSQRFLDEVDASCVMVNASSRFNDGQQLGLGAEIGIATTKLHSYGPMGLEDLTTTKFVVYGQGQIRG